MSSSFRMPQADRRKDRLGARASDFQGEQGLQPRFWVLVLAQLLRPFGNLPLRSGNDRIIRLCGVDQRGRQRRGEKQGEKNVGHHGRASIEGKADDVCENSWRRQDTQGALLETKLGAAPRP